MEKSSLSLIQLKIVDALEHLKDKSHFTEAVLAKSVRISGKIDGKKKAGIALNDLENAIAYLSENNLFYSISTNSVNEILIEKSDSLKLLDSEAKKRRLSSEKSMLVFTNSDVNEKSDSKKIKALKDKKKIRAKTEKINIYSDFENLDD